MNTSDKSKLKENDKLSGKEKQKMFNFRWTIKIAIITFCISACLSLLSETASENLNLWAAVIILFLFIFLGIIFDILGVSVATANETQFNSMATKKVRGARAALWFVSKADSVANFCNDVIGDISGVLSGTMSIVIASGIASGLHINKLIISIAVTAVTAALTVGGKALGKNLAMKKSNDIVYLFAKIICFIIPEKKFIKK